MTASAHDDASPRERVSRVPALAAIVVRPRATMRRILDHPPYRGVHLIVVAAMFSSALSDMNWNDAGGAAAAIDPRLTLAIVIGLLILMPLIAIAFFYLLTASATLAGRLVGGSGGFRQVRAAIAWGFAPIVWALVYRIPAAIFWVEATVAAPQPILRVGSDTVVYRSGGLFGGAPWWQVVLLACLDLAIVAWYLIVASACLAEA
ncbi:MAG TPA: Yip1 family protein, partial [Thermoanaerobaculia bacterium]|nr:Yip1 family protein [Thermoanaerobaculia bacterium]